LFFCGGCFWATFVVDSTRLTESALMKQLLFTAVAAAAITLAASPALAYSTATASLGPIAFTLHDLTPLDGVGSSIAFDALNNSYVESTTVDYGSQAVKKWFQAPWNPVSAATNTSHSAGQVSISGGGLTGFVGVEISLSSTTSFPDDHQGSRYASHFLIATGDSSFTLSANTSVVFSAPASFAGNAQGDSPGLDSYDTASAVFLFSVAGEGLSGLDPLATEDNFQGGATADSYQAVTPSFSDSRVMSVVFNNTTSETLRGRFHVLATSGSHSSAVVPLPVPEPETYAMLLAGLGLMGAVVRSRPRTS
jgi:hypothetical protein